MGQDQFNAMMPVISADIVAMVTEKRNISKVEAIRLLYSSKLYAALEQEDTKVWQYSTYMLYDLLERKLDPETSVSLLCTEGVYGPRNQVRHFLYGEL